MKLGIEQRQILGYNLFVPTYAGELDWVANDFHGYGLEIRPGDTVVEIGSAFGYVPIFLYHQFGDKISYIGCEPFLFNWLSAYANFKFYNLPSCYQNHNVGLWTEERDTFMAVYDGGNCVANYVTDTATRFRAKLVPPHLIFPEKVDVMIIDCEGAEWLILDKLPKCREAAVELHFFKDKHFVKDRDEKWAQDVLSQKTERFKILSNPD